MDHSANQRLNRRVIRHPSPNQRLKSSLWYIFDICCCCILLLQLWLFNVPHLWHTFSPQNTGLEGERDMMNSHDAKTHAAHPKHHQVSNAQKESYWWKEAQKMNSHWMSRFPPDIFFYKKKGSLPKKHFELAFLGFLTQSTCERVPLHSYGTKKRQQKTTQTKTEKKKHTHQATGNPWDNYRHC